MTNSDLKQIGKLLDEKLEAQEKRIVSKTVKLIKDAIEESETHIIEIVDKHKADKEDVRNLDTRITKLEQTVLP